MSKIYDNLIIMLFIFVIFVPLVFVNTVPGKISTDENRALASFPSFRTGDGKLNTKGFEDWFKDNLGFRDKLVKALTLIQYNLFGYLPKTDEIVGKDNWIFYYTTDIIKDYQHLNLPSEQQLIEWGNSIGRINNYLKSKKIPFIFMLCPDKKTIYPEKYPDTILKVGKVSRTDILTKYFTEKMGIDFFTPIKSLLEAKFKFVVYSPRYDNAHWNSYGEFIGYLELMNKVKKYFPNIKILSWNDFNITEYKRERKVYGAVPFSEIDYAFKLKNGSSATQTQRVLDSLNLKSSNLCYTYVNNNNNLPKVLILGDSYFYGLSIIPYLAESFSQLTFIHTANSERIESFIKSFEPDMVIYESAERMFDITVPLLTKVLMNANEKFTDYSAYVNLPVVAQPEQFGLMWLDYYNEKQITKQGEITIDPSLPLVTMSGWALDPNSKSTADSIYIKVGNECYKGTYGLERTSVSDYFKNTSLTYSGFTFNINTKDLIKTGKFNFIIISKNRSYQYQPIAWKVKSLVSQH